MSRNKLMHRFFILCCTSLVCIGVSEKRARTAGALVERDSCGRNENRGSIEFFAPLRHPGFSKIYATRSTRNTHDILLALYYCDYPRKHYTSVIWNEQHSASSLNLQC